uniref:Uncharacterized protein n=1 Tax=viral metagenome TaxID=1070528 RepID=A0A6C0HK20_9ZZZZ
MILKASIVGMAVLLIIVLTISYYINEEGFISQMTASQAIAMSGGMVFMCSTGDIRGGNGTGPYQLSTVNGVSTITVATGSTATVSISNCQALKLGANTAADVMMASPTTAPATAPTTAPMTAPMTAATTAPMTAPMTAPATSATGRPTTLGSSLTSATSTAVPQSASKPKRNDIRPDIDVSKTAQKAMYLKQQSDFLKDLQMMIRNELRSARATDSSTVESNGSCDETSAISQGKEYTSNTIKKDAIPCWGCSLDY